MISEGVVEKQVADAKPWRAHFTLHTFPEGNSISVEKEGVATLGDLKWECEEEANMDWQYMDICCNSQTLFYPDNTLIQDLGFKQEDELTIIAKPVFEDEQARELYQNKRKQAEQRNVLRIIQMNNILRQERTIISQDSTLKDKYNQLIKQYPKDICLKVIAENRNDLIKLDSVISTDNSRRQVEKTIAKMNQSYEQEIIKSLLKKPMFKEIKDKIFYTEHKDAEAMFGIVMRQLVKQHSEIKAAFERNPHLFKKHFFAESHSQPNSKDNNRFQTQEQERIALVQSIVEIILGEQSNPPKLAKKDHEQLIKQMRTNYSVEQIEKALMSSGNNTRLARQMLDEQWLDSHQNLFNSLSQKAKKSVVLLFFGQIKLQPLRDKLRYKVNKAESFLDHYIQVLKKRPFTRWIKQYRGEILTILTGINCVDRSPERQDFKKAQSEQLSHQQIDVIRKQVKACYSKQLAQMFVDRGFEERVIVHALRVTQNKVEDMIEYIKLGGVVPQYDFCPSGTLHEEAYLTEEFEGKEQLLGKLKDPQEMNMWLAQIMETRPLLFEILLRNKPYFDKLAANSQTVNLRKGK